MDLPRREYDWQSAGCAKILPPEMQSVEVVAKLVLVTAAAVSRFFGFRNSFLVALVQRDLS